MDDVNKGITRHLDNTSISNPSTDTVEIYCDICKQKKQVRFNHGGICAKCSIRICGDCTAFERHPHKVAAAQNFDPETGMD
jgi:hypothetical protein